jgi:SUN family beta-glucosidase
MKRYILAAAVASAAANPHLHKHRHLHERDAVTTTDIVATATVYEVAGTQIPKDEACAAVAAGKYTWKDPNDAAVCASSAAAASAAASSPPPPAVPSPPPASSVSAEAGQFFGNPAGGSAPSPPAGIGSGSDWTDSGATGVDADFPDGQLDCSTFPSQYGAVAAPWLNMNGWIGLQDVGGNTNGPISSIKTL